MLPDGAKRRPPNAGKGRVKGVPNKITGDVRQMVLDALAAAGGAGYLQRQADENPAAFLALVGKTLPKDIKLGGSLAVEVNLVPRK